MLTQRNPATKRNKLEIRSLKGNFHPEPVDILAYEAAPLGNQVMDTICQLVSALDRDRVARQPVEGTIAL
jgi:hypothetical protein